MTSLRRVAIVGSRPPPKGAPAADRDLFKKLSAQCADFVQALPKGTVVVSGGAAGIDTVAAFSAELAGLQVVVHAPRDEDGPERFHMRNQRIVDDSQELVAWVTPWARGSWDAIRRARAKGIRVVVHRVVSVGQQQEEKQK